MSSTLISTSTNTTLTTKGDILIHNGTSSTRLAVGTDGQAVHSSTGSIKIAWSSASTQGSPNWKLISSTTLTASASSVVFSNTPSAQGTLIVVSARNTSTIRAIAVTFNTNYTGRYNSVYAYWSAGSYTRALYNSDTVTMAGKIDIINAQAESDTAANTMGYSQIMFHQNTANTNGISLYTSTMIPRTLVSGTSDYIEQSDGMGYIYGGQVPVGTITISTGGAFAANSSFQIYVKQIL